jgi:hypothetical protein
MARRPEVGNRFEKDIKWIDRGEEIRQRDKKTHGPLGDWGEEQRQEAARLQGDPHGHEFSDEPGEESGEDELIARIDQERAGKSQEASFEEGVESPKTQWSDSVTESDSEPEVPGSEDIGVEPIDQQSSRAGVAPARGGYERLRRDMGRFDKRNKRNDNSARINLDVQKRKAQKAAGESLVQ